jgi:hypothetical protein
MVHRQVLVVERDPRSDAVIGPWFGNVSKRLESFGDRRPEAHLIIASIQRPDGTWLTARMLAPANERQVILSLLLQTILLYLVLVGAVALILRRIARPLKADQPGGGRPRAQRRWATGTRRAGRHPPPDRGAQRHGRTDHRPAR